MSHACVINPAPHRWCAASSVRPTALDHPGLEPTYLCRSLLGGPASAAVSPHPPCHSFPLGPRGPFGPWPKSAVLDAVLRLFGFGLESRDLGRQVRLVAADALPRNPRFRHPSHAKRPFFKSRHLRSGRVSGPSRPPLGPHSPPTSLGWVDGAPVGRGLGRLNVLTAKPHCL